MPAKEEAIVTESVVPANFIFVASQVAKFASVSILDLIVLIPEEVVILIGVSSE